MSMFSDTNNLKRLRMLRPTTPVRFHTLTFVASSLY
ncbi:uncharacterized protein METZ01_LOCUS353842 [marine metagenome]|uniref:Uncharacterized protein n=1 Tax=marine metagenome TaxID=408172 RepID=A0A382RVM7_9ZZZZ